MLKNGLVFFATLACLLAILDAEKTGGVSGLKGKDFQKAVKKLKVALNKVEALDGPIYIISKVKRATDQVVSGIITRYVAVLIGTLGNKRNCNVSIWEQPWLANGTEVKIFCKGLKKYVITY